MPSIHYGFRSKVLSWWPPYSRSSSGWVAPSACCFGSSALCASVRPSRCWVWDCSRALPAMGRSTGGFASRMLNGILNHSCLFIINRYILSSVSWNYAMRIFTRGYHGCFTAMQLRLPTKLMFCFVFAERWSWSLFSLSILAIFRFPVLRIRKTGAFTNKPFLSSKCFPWVKMISDTLP